MNPFLHSFRRLAAGLFLSLPVLSPAEPSILDYADPMVGTELEGYAFPGATVPFGLVSVSPDTSDFPCSGYHYNDPAIQGFSHTHLVGTGVGELGDVMIMPIVGDVRFDAGTPGNGYVSRFSHANEKASPGYYRVFLDDPKVTAEMTATARTGFHRYTFPTTDKAHFILDLVHGVSEKAYEAQLTVENNSTITGYRKTHGWSSDRSVFFVAEFSPHFSSWGFESNGHRLAGETQEARGEQLKAYVGYSTASNQPVLIKVGISPTSIEGARRNLQTENANWNFEQVREAAETQWKTALSTIECTSSDPHLVRTFYSNLYLSLLAPALNNDADGDYRGMDHQIHTGDFQNYTEFSLWDTYRAEHPLIEIIQPQRISDMMKSLLTEYHQLGQHSLPIWPLWSNETWCMWGYHSADEIVDAYSKGFDIGDPEAAYQAIRDTAMGTRADLDLFRKFGYVPSQPHREAATKTLEYCVDDWNVAKMAEDLGHADDSATFYQRAANYRNLFDGTSRFFRGRKEDGSWRTPFDTRGLAGDEYTEADAWQYAFYVQQDVPGLIALYGGDEPFIEKLDSLFASSSVMHGMDTSGMVGQYNQGDEQCHHVAYLYDYAGQPWKTQQHVRQVMVTQYNDTPKGQCGNVDCGQMSAWYVLSALGFYAVNPASDVYAIGSPVMDEAVIHLNPQFAKGTTFTITALNNSPNNVYVESADLNGQPLPGPWFTHAQLTAGGELRLTMGSTPNKKWGLNPANRPPATMPSGFQYGPLPSPAPPVVASVPMHINCGRDPVGDFTPDFAAMENLGIAGDLKARIDTNTPHAAPEAVYQSECYGSDFAFVLPVPPGEPYLVRLHFDEIFGGSSGTRREDVTINHQPALTNFDIFRAAGGPRKAVVRDFPNISPDAKGNISIRIRAADGSPDRNAKIDGIEILPMSAADVNSK